MAEAKAARVAATDGREPCGVNPQANARKRGGRRSTPTSSSSVGEKLENASRSGAGACVARSEQNEVDVKFLYHHYGIISYLERIPRDVLPGNTCSRSAGGGKLGEGKELRFRLDVIYKHATVSRATCCPFCERKE